MSLDYVSQAVLETVAKITHEKTKRNDTQEGKYGNVLHSENLPNVYLSFYYYGNKALFHLVLLFISGTRSFQFQDVFSIENEDTDDMTTLIDKKVRLIF